jgi:hypothetical protein
LLSWGVHQHLRSALLSPYRRVSQVLWAHILCICASDEHNPIRRTSIILPSLSVSSWPRVLVIILCQTICKFDWIIEHLRNFSSLVSMCACLVFFAG